MENISLTLPFAAQAVVKDIRISTLCLHNPLAVDQTDPLRDTIPEIKAWKL
jgi:hypothetical protein